MTKKISKHSIGFTLALWTAMSGSAFAGGISAGGPPTVYPLPPAADEPYMEVYDTLDVPASPVPVSAGWAAYEKSIGGLSCIQWDGPKAAHRYTCSMADTGIQAELIYKALNVPAMALPTPFPLSGSQKNAGALSCSDITNQQTGEEKFSCSLRSIEQPAITPRPVVDPRVIYVCVAQSLKETLYIVQNSDSSLGLTTQLESGASDTTSLILVSSAGDPTVEYRTPGILYITVDRSTGPVVDENGNEHYPGRKFQASSPISHSEAASPVELDCVYK